MRITHTLNYQFDLNINWQNKFWQILGNNFQPTTQLKVDFCRDINNSIESENVSLIISGCQLRFKWYFLNMWILLANKATLMTKL